MKVLVLNMDYSPINITTLQKGFKLVFKGKAEVVTHESENPIVTDKKDYIRPTVIRLLKYIVLPFKKVHLSRQNIFKRDDNECIYCGATTDLTIDHVIPRSKGGSNTWENLVTCCGMCNVRKCSKDVDEFLSEYNLTMRHKPFRPSYLYFVEKINRISNDWKQYLGFKNE
jgi:5-methylcytosine-specific restriction endonuclease McrA